MFGKLTPSGPRDDQIQRAISAVVGVALMLVITILLASMVAGFALTFDERLEEPELEEIENNVNPWEDQEGLLAPEDPTAGAEDVRYRLLFEVKDTSMEGDSLGEVGITVDTGDDMFSGTDQDKIETIEVEKTDGTELNITDEVDNWVIDNDGSYVQVGLTGSVYTNPKTGDEITVILAGVDNPNNPGTYDVTVSLNEGEDEQDGELEIIG